MRAWPSHGTGFVRGRNKYRVDYKKVEPKEYMTYGNKIYWEFKNFKPKANSRITEKYHVNELNY